MSGPTLPARAVASSTDILTEFFGFHGDLPLQEYSLGAAMCLFLQAVGSRGSSGDGDQFWGEYFIGMSDGHAFYANTAFTLLTTSSWQVSGCTFLWLARAAEMARRSSVQQQQVCRRPRERPNTSSIIPHPPPPLAKTHAQSTQNERGESTNGPDGRGAARQRPRHLARRGCQASCAASAALRRTAAATATAELRPDCAHGAEDGRESVRPVGSWQRVRRAVGGLV